MELIVPTDYDPKMDVIQTEKAIRFIRENFQDDLHRALNLTRISAPMFVEAGSGLNDNLNGVETPVSFTMKDMPGKTAVEVVHSLAKWKRVALKRYGFGMHEGLFANMNAIRKDEDLDNLHSIYVDQWDWERIISKDERNTETLKKTVVSVYSAIKEIEQDVIDKYPSAAYHLPKEIHFVTTQQLEDAYPELTPKQRENAICKKYGAVFLMQIGGKLKSGKRHEGRAPDYDDWKLNGDILFWYEPLQRALEISSMGIRVDAKAMVAQLKETGEEKREALPFHQMILHDELPYTVGGGIGQSRLCMLLLGKAHVGEVQASIWPQEYIEKCKKNKINLL